MKSDELFFPILRSHAIVLRIESKSSTSDIITTNKIDPIYEVIPGLERTFLLEKKIGKAIQLTKLFSWKSLVIHRDCHQKNHSE